MVSQEVGVFWIPTCWWGLGLVIVARRDLYLCWVRFKPERQRPTVDLYLAQETYDEFVSLLSASEDCVTFKHIDQPDVLGLSTRL
jgi:hypothetical protein